MSAKVFVVTGANKGIGYGIVRGLARTQKGATIYLTARNPSLGEEALKKLESELGPANVTAQLLFHQLDITDRNSCDALGQHLKKSHGTIDVLVNNAGFAFKQSATESDGQQADETIAINYYGTKQVSAALAPRIRDNGGRIVNVCSQAGIMNGGDWMKFTYKKELVDRFRRPDFTEADIDAFVEEYKRLAHAGTRKEGGYPESAYAVSKAAEIALSVLQARQLSSRGILVNACCPGYVDTDMTSHKGHLSIDEGAETPLFLATDPAVTSGGQFYYQKRVKEWLL